jgi:uncharacterized membrane protein YdjX (TVP38/TMEM64 family)
MRRLARRAAALIALACLAFLLVRAAATFDYSAHTFRLIEWLRHDVSVAKGLAAVTLLTAIGTPMMVTTTPLNVGAGAVYGVFLGALASVIGAVAGASVCFLVSRFGPGVRHWAREKIRESAMLTALDAALERGGAGIVMLSRLSPLFPFATCSFAFGACRVGWADFLLGTAVGLAPGALMMAWIGHNVQQYAKHGATGDGEHGAWEVRRLWGTVALTALAGGALAVRVNQIVKRAAAEADPGGRRAKIRDHYGREESIPSRGINPSRPHEFSRPSSKGFMVP